MAACLVTDSAYILVVFDRGGKGKEVLDSRFTGPEEGAGGDRITGVGLAGRGGVASEASVGTSCDRVLSTSLDQTLDPGSCHPPDSVVSGFVLSVVGV